MSARVPNDRVVAEPNVTPMIDVLLVLLVTFLVALPLSRRTIDAQLPQPAPTGDPPPSISLTVRATDGFLLNGEPLRDGAALAARLRAVYANRPDRTIFIGAEPGVRYAAVIAAMDAARGAGVRVIGVTPKGSLTP
jgi:biopolymer transport protein TolR